jgi:hypothetical protein
MPEEALILKRNPDADYSESYNVLFEGRYVGRIYKAVFPRAARSPVVLGPRISRMAGQQWTLVGERRDSRSCKAVRGAP